MQTSELVKYVKKELDALLDTATNLKAQRDKLRKEYEENKTQCALQNQKYQANFSALESEKQSLLEQEKRGCDREIRKLLDTQKAKLVNLESQLRTKLISSIENNYPEASNKISGLQKSIYESKMKTLQNFNLIELVDLNDQLVQFRVHTSKSTPTQPTPSQPALQLPPRPAPPQPTPSQSRAPPLPDHPPGMKISRPPKLFGSKAHHYRDFVVSRLLANGFDYNNPEDRKLINIVSEACECYPLELKLKTIALKISSGQDISKKDLVNQLVLLMKDANQGKKCLDSENFPEGDRCYISDEEAKKLIRNINRS